MIASRFVRFSRGKRGPEIPVSIAAIGGEDVIEVDAEVAPPGLSSLISLDLLQQLVPELRNRHAADFHREDGTYWSPYVGVALRGASPDFTGATKTWARMCVSEGHDTVVLSDAIVQSMGEYREEPDGTGVLSHPLMWPFMTSLPDLLRSAVLVLGTDSTTDGLARMRIIQSELNIGSRRGLIVRDVADYHHQSTEEKVAMYAASAAMVIVEHSFASGAIAELSLLRSIRSTVAVLREEGRGATWLQADYDVDQTNVREFVYSMDPESRRPPALHVAAHEAFAWGMKRLAAKAELLDERLPWRRAQTVLEERVSPSHGTRVFLESISVLASHIASLLREMVPSAVWYVDPISDDGNVRAGVHVDPGSEALLVLSGNVLSRSSRALLELELTMKDGAQETLLETSQRYTPATYRWHSFLDPHFSDVFVYDAESDGVTRLTDDLVRVWLCQLLGP